MASSRIRRLQHAIQRTRSTILESWGEDMAAVMMEDSVLASEKTLHHLESLIEAGEELTLTQIVNFRTMAKDDPVGRSIMMIFDVNSQNIWDREALTQDYMEALRIDLARGAM
jgi:hypothetical protein